MEEEIANIFAPSSAPWNATLVDTYIKQTMKAPIPKLSIQRKALNKTVVEIVDNYIEHRPINASIAIQAFWRGYRIRRHDFFNGLIEHIIADNRNAKVQHLQRDNASLICFKHIDQHELPGIATRYLLQTDSRKYVGTIPMVAVLSVCSQSALVKMIKASGHAVKTRMKREKLYEYAGTERNVVKMKEIVHKTLVKKAKQQMSMMIPGSGLGNDAIFKHFEVWEEQFLQDLKPKQKKSASAKKKKNILASERTDRQFLVTTSSPHHIVSWSNDDIMHPFNAKYTIGQTGTTKMNSWSPAEFMNHVSRSVSALCAYLITHQLPSSVAEIMVKRDVLRNTKLNVFADENIALKEVCHFGRAYDVSDAVYDRVKGLIFSDDRQSHYIAVIKAGTDNCILREDQFGIFDGQNGAIFIVKLLIYCSKKQRASSTFCIAGLYMDSNF